MANDNETSREHREQETKVFVTAGIVAMLGLFMGVISRMPSSLRGFSSFGLDLAINAGDIVVLGPIVLLGGIAWIKISIGRVHEDADFAKPNGTKVLRSRGVSFLPFVLPGIAMLFLWVQFVQGFAPPVKTTPTGIGSCDTFQPWRQMLFDTSLRSGKYVYCFSGIDEQQQQHMPQICPPYQTWAWLAMALAGLYLCATNWLRWTSFPAAPVRTRPRTKRRPR